MNRYLKPVFVLITLALLASSSAQAGSEEKIIIALKSDDFELAEIDVSNLAVGESETIESDSGKVIDILRTKDGVEIYVDGELLDLNFAADGLHEAHAITKHIEIICDSDEACDENVFFMAGDDAAGASWFTEDGHTVFVHKEIELSCTDDDEETNCTEEMLWFSAGEDMDLEALHELHANGDGEGHRIIMIKKHIDTQD